MSAARHYRTAGTILVVEDQTGLRELVSGFLEDLGFAVVAAADGAEALRIIAGGQGVSLLFTDIDLPGGPDGFELAARAKALRPGLKVLYASGRPDGDGEAPALPRHGRLFPKPYRLQALAAEIAHLLAPPDAAHPRKRRVPPLSPKRLPRAQRVRHRPARA